MRAGYATDGATEDATGSTSAVLARNCCQPDAARAALPSLELK